MTRQKDILDELTKDELLAWVRTQLFRLPKRSEILAMRWSKQSDDLLAAFEAENRSQTRLISQSVTGSLCNTTSQLAPKKSSDCSI